MIASFGRLVAEPEALQNELLGNDDQGSGQNCRPTGSNPDQDMRMVTGSQLVGSDLRFDIDPGRFTGKLKIISMASDGP